MDDIFIIEKTKKKYRKRIRKTLKKLLKIELRIKLSKNEFEKEKVKFLGHNIEKEDIKLDSKKIRTLRE